MSRTPGESALPLRETHGNIPRRWSDAPLALTRTPLAVERAPQAFLPLDHTTAPPGRRQEPCTPPMPLAVLGEARGRFSTPDERARRGSRALCPRTTHRDGGVTLPRYPF